MKRDDLFGGLLFLPAMVMLAAVVFTAFYALIRAGHWLAFAWYGLLHDTLALPHSVALTLTVFLVPLTFAAVIRLLWGARRPARKA